MRVADERRMAELRYRSSRNRMLTIVVLCITSVIFIVLLLYNLERMPDDATFTTDSQPQTQVAKTVVNPTSVPNGPLAQPKQRSVIQPKSTERQNPVVPVGKQTRIRAPQVPIERRQPGRMVPRAPDSEQDIEITLDLSKSRQRYPIGSVVRIQVLPPTQPGNMSPADGVVDSRKPLTITFLEPFKPRIAVSLDDEYIWLKYEVEAADGRLVPFTTTNLESIRRKVTQNGRTSVALVRRLSAEKVKLEAYLVASGGKLWHEKRAAELRLIALPGLIATAQNRVATLEMDLRAVEELIELAKNIEGTKLRICASK